MKGKIFYIIIVLLLAAIVAVTFYLFSFLSEKKTAAINRSNAEFRAGMEQLNSGNPDKAVKYFSGYIRDYPADGYGYFCRGYAHEQKNRYRLAIEDYTKAIELLPDSITFYYNRAGASLVAGDFEAALKDIERLKTLKPEYGNANEIQAEALYKSAYNKVESSDFAAAEELLTKAAELNGKSVQIFYARGVCRENLKRYKEAIEDYSKAIELKPSNGEFYKSRGFLYYLQKNYRQAIADFDWALEIDPNSAATYFNRGLCHSFIKNYSKAINDFTKAIELKPDKADYYLNRGMVELDAGQYNAALNDMNNALRLNSGIGMAYAVKGYAQVKLEIYKEAAENFRKAVQLDGSLKGRLSPIMEELTKAGY
ncbi:MAG: tetratricopeptide repeat protein [Ignavibacteria bacterium]|nr:tetratricopeptide repeat protein [Ignavibacteria bacterium]